MRGVKGLRAASGSGPRPSSGPRCGHCDLDDSPFKDAWHWVGTTDDGATQRRSWANSMPNHGDHELCGPGWVTFQPYLVGTEPKLRALPPGTVARVLGTGPHNPSTTLIVVAVSDVAAYAADVRAGLKRARDTDQTDRVATTRALRVVRCLERSPASADALVQEALFAVTLGRMGVAPTTPRTLPRPRPGKRWTVAIPGLPKPHAREPARYHYRAGYEWPSTVDDWNSVASLAHRARGDVNVLAHVAMDVLRLSRRSYNRIAEAVDTLVNLESWLEDAYFVGHPPKPLAPEGIVLNHREPFDSARAVGLARDIEANDAITKVDPDGRLRSIVWWLKSR